MPRPYVTRGFRDKMVEAYPGLDRNPAYWRLVHYLVFGTHRDDASGELVVANKTLAALEGRERQHDANNYNGRRLLEDFKRDVAPNFDYSDWTFVDGRARTVLFDGLDTDVHIWADEMTEAIFRDDGVVDVVSGVERTRQKVARDDAAVRKSIVLASAASGLARETRRVIEYQNALGKKGFSDAVKRHFDSALVKAGRLPIEGSRRQALQTLAAVRLHPKPFIQPKARSPRAFSVGASLLTVKSALRREFTRRWVDYDLKGAQLAIVGHLWGFDPFLDFVESRMGSVWEYLADALDLPLEPSKGFIKSALYSLVFGASKRTVRRALDRKSGVAGLGERFLANDLVVRVYEAREREIARIMTNGGAATALGKEIRIEQGSPFHERHAEARSILAQQAQAIELLLVLPIYEVATRTTQFDIMLYQFDGVTIRFKDRRNWRKWQTEICDAVAERARDLEVNTNLECSPGKDFNWK